MDDGRCSYFFLLYPYNYPNYDVTSNDITKQKTFFNTGNVGHIVFFAFFFLVGVQVRRICPYHSSSLGEKLEAAAVGLGGG